MAFVKKTWVERAVEFAGRRLLTPVSGTADTFDVTREEGTEFIVGDSFSATNMNDLESRVDNAIIEVGSNIVKKNWIINGGFDIWQRAISQTSSGYGSDDRFLNENLGSTKVHSQQSFALGQTDVPNNPTNFSRTVVTSVAGVGNYSRKSQRIEDVSKLSGKTVSLSFWAKADASKNIAIEFVQNFGTGGSTQVTSIGSQKLALTTAWQRFTVSVEIPLISGKTIGANNYLELLFWFDAGSDFNTRTNTLGQQSGTFDLANISLVENGIAQEWKNEQSDIERLKCYRYYQRFGGLSPIQVFGIGSAYSTGIARILIVLLCEMRTITTLEYSGISLNDGVSNIVATSASLTRLGKNTVPIDVSGSGLTQFRNYYLQANNSNNGYIALDGEL